MTWTTVAIYLSENWVEIAGFITTVAGIWLTTKRSMLCWPVIVAADVLYLVVFYHAQLLSDALLQAFFLVFTFYGWWNWRRGVRQDGEVRVVPLSARSLWIGLLAGAAGSFVLGILAKQLHAALPFLDATLTSFSLVASWWGARKHTANWQLWIVVDVTYIGEYIYKDLQATALLYAILVWLAALGLRDWKRAETKADQLAA
jgi:nicotinamide mononucleotide transporter